MVMIRKRRLIWVGVIALILPVWVHSASPEPPKLVAKAYVLLDYHSGKVLAGQDQDLRLEPASLTKIMTSYVVFHELHQNHIQLTDEVLVSKKAWQTPGSRMFIEVNRRITVEELIKGMIIQSGNDASVALAEHVAGSEDSFASLMNDHAQKLGMVNSHFINSTGLPDPEHYSTAHDLAILSAAIIRQFPEDYRWFSEKSFTFNNIVQHNRNLLLTKDDSVDGLKTGHTETAGYCLVASAKREEMRLISVILGSKSQQIRADDTMSLLNFGFRFYESHRLYGAQESLKEARIWQGEVKQLNLGLAQDLFITIPRGQYKNLQAAISVNEPILAPVENGTPVGKLEIKLENQPIASPDLVALQPVAEGGVWSLIRDKILLLFQ